MLTRDDKTRRIEDRIEPVESVLAQETTLKGNLRGPYGIRVMGILEGDIESGGRVKIEKGGRVRGKIKASDVIVNGELDGHIETEGQVELGRESRMVGNIRAAKIAIADGCFFQGEIKMSPGEVQPVKFVEKRTPKAAVHP
jgi:cytoskeletal protein CcmA (bactofilin family)